MTNERLQSLKIRVARADTLATDIEALETYKHEGDSEKLSYLLRCEVYRLGREALIKQKSAELESLLTEPKSEYPVIPEDVTHIPSYDYVPSYDKDFGFGAQ